MKILNLYACLGGNRYKWNEVKNDIEVTAVEIDPECVRLYKKRFPQDKVIQADAHQYLLEHYKEFDFIWSSPPCPTHSIARAYNPKYKTLYPDLKLYEEIIMLLNVSNGKNPRFKGKFIVENVIPYYEPLIPAKKKGRHLYWSNFNIPNILSNRKNPQLGHEQKEIEALSEFHDYDFTKYKGKQRIDKIARNLVDYEAGKTILETIIGIEKNQNKKQLTLL